MNDRKQKNIELLSYAAARLEPLLADVVFLGGCTTGLFITDPAAPDVRPTQDVDVIVEIHHRNDYAILEEKLRDLGFRQPIEDETPVICRWRHGDLLLDVMPTDEKILGFGNLWYPAAIAHAEHRILENKLGIRIVTPAYFIGTKLEAFEGRGNDDLLASHDFEDVITVVDGRPELLNELRVAELPLRRYICERFVDYKSRPGFRDVLQGHLPDSRTSPSRLKRLENDIQSLCELVKDN